MGENRRVKRLRNPLNGVGFDLGAMEKQEGAEVNDSRGRKR